MEYITCEKCGCQMSALSEACPVCGTLTDESKHVEEISLTHEVEECGQIPDTANVFSIFKSNKRAYWAVASVLVFLFIGYVGYKVCNRQDERREAITNAQQINNEQNLTSESEIPIKNTETIKNLTMASVEDAFLRHWEHYKSNRELIPLEGCNKGYKITFGDLNNDGIDDAVVNAYVTPSTKEISNNDYDDKSYIFCFLNDNGRCKLVTATRFNKMFFVDEIGNGTIFSHCFLYMVSIDNGDSRSEKEEHRFRLDGDQLIENGAEATNHLEDLNEDDFEEGWFYGYEGEMEGFPVKIDFGVLSDGIIEGEYQNVKYGTVLSLKGQLNSDKSLHMEGVDKSEEIFFKLSFSSPEYLVGHGIMGKKSLKIKLKQTSSELINDSH